MSMLRSLASPTVLITSFKLHLEEELPREMRSMMREREAVVMSGINMVVVGLEEEQGREERMERSQGEKRRRVETEVVMEESLVTNNNFFSSSSCLFS